jgi:hypothetical protein
MRISDLQYPYLHLVRLNALASKQGCSPKIMKGDEVSHDTLNKVLLSPFEGPNFNWMNLPFVTGRSTFAETPANSALYLYTKGEYQIDEVYPEYLKIPVNVYFGGYNSLDGVYIAGITPPINSDLPVAYHRRIVDIAVANASDYINKPDYAQKLQKTFRQ